MMVFSSSTAVDVVAQSAANAAWFTAWVTLGGVVVAVFALLAVVRQIRDAGKQMKDSAIENEKNLQAQTRPYLGVEFVSGVAGAPSMDIVIANSGRTTASNILLNIEGGFNSQSEEDQIGPALGRLFAVPFDLAPNTRRRVFWRIPDETGRDPRGDIGAPVKGAVLIGYDWERSPGASVVHYEEQVTYDLTEYPKLMPSPRTGPKQQGNSVEVAATNVVHVLRAIAEHIAELRR